MSVPNKTDSWRKSSYSQPSENCVEVATGPVIGVRDTKDRAGGQLAAYTCLSEKRLYDASDKADALPFTPNFVVLVYAGGIVDKGGDETQGDQGHQREVVDWQVQTAQGSE